MRFKMTKKNILNKIDFSQSTKVLTFAYLNVKYITFFGLEYYLILD